MATRGSLVPDLLVCGRSAGPLRVSGRYRRTVGYRRYAAAWDAAATYSEAVTVLERLGRNPSADVRAGAALDFAPVLPQARRFLNTTSLALGRPQGDPMRVLAERAVRALGWLQSGPEGRRGRPRQETVSADRVRRIVEARRDWLESLRSGWAAGRLDRSLLRRDVTRACRGRVPTATAYSTALETLLRRPGLRMVDLANQLTAWQEAVSVRCVRAIVHAALVPRSADRMFA